MGQRGGLQRGPAAVRRPAVDTSQARNANTAGALCGQVKDSLALGGGLFFFCLFNHPESHLGTIIHGF